MDTIDVAGVARLRTATPLVSEFWRIRLIVAAIATLTFCCPSIRCYAQDRSIEAVEAAVKFASPSVVQIDTIGGLTPKGQSRSTAAFSGTVVSEDGLILTASYNLLHEPASVFVRLPGKDGQLERFAAQTVATDNSRNLTLLKIEQEGLIPVQFGNRQDIQTGERAIAIGKSISAIDPNISMGIVSAKGRVWNRATQTDAKISRQNYGGPLVGLGGKAIGILVPMSHRSSEAGAGSEWYDSGIGFAATVDPDSEPWKRFLAGDSLRAGLAGLSFEGSDPNADSAKVSFCLPTSPAGKAGLKKGDTIVQAAGQRIVRQGQFKHVIGPLYENETLAVKVDRDGEMLEFEIELAGEIDPYVEPELGILLSLLDEQAVVKSVFEDSPAATSGLEAGCTIAKVNSVEVTTPSEARLAISQLVVGEECRIKVRQGSKATELKIVPRRQLAQLFSKIPGRHPAQQRRFESMKISVAEGSNECFAFVPEQTDVKEESERAKPSVLVWVPSPGPVDADKMFEKFENLCTSSDTLVLVPQSVDPEKWLPDDASVIAKALEKLEQREAFDRNRVAIAGKGSGGEMAMLTAFSNRKLFKGVAVVDAELSTNLPNVQSLPSTRLHMLVLGNEDNAESVQFFREKGFSIFAEVAPGNAIKAVLGWLETLDRL